MGIISSTAFWIMCGIMWLLATPIIITVINSVTLGPVEGFLMMILPWTVLLSIIYQIYRSLQGAERGA